MFCVDLRYLQVNMIYDLNSSLMGILKAEKLLLLRRCCSQFCCYMLYLWNGEKEDLKQKLRNKLKWAVSTVLLFFKKSMKDTLSVITICFNNLPELIRTCQSVDRQSQHPDEQ